MKTICLYFQIHQPFRLRRYRFFDIGSDDYYYDDYANETTINTVAEKSYLRANEIILEQIKKHKGKFRVAYSISGTALDQFKLYAPQVIESFKKLADTGYVEFLAETNSHSLASLKDKEEFFRQIRIHGKKIEKYFDQVPKIFRNTELIYSDSIGVDIEELGFKGVLIEGAKHILGHNNPNYLYCNPSVPRLKVLCRNYELSDDIAFRFSNKNWNEYPLTAEKYTHWINSLNPKDEIVNIFMDYETFGEHHSENTGIFQFLKHLPDEILKHSHLTFDTPTNIVKTHQIKEVIYSPYPTSWADQEKDLSAWLGNDLQNEAFNKLYKLRKLISLNPDKKTLTNWNYLQTSDHFYYMSTKILSDGDVHQYFNPYESPYDAFINYMNILSDFENTLRENCNTKMPQEELLKIISEKDQQIKNFQQEVIGLKLGVKAKLQDKVASKKKKTIVKTKKTTNEKTVLN